MSVQPPYSRSEPRQFYRAYTAGTGLTWNYSEDREVYTVSGSGMNNRPNWRRLPQPQKSDPLPYYKTYNDCPPLRTFAYVSQASWDEFGTYSATAYQTQSWLSWDLWPSRDATAIDDAYNLSKGRLLDKLKGEGANLANAFAERKQTISLVTSTIERLYRTIKDLRRGNIKAALRRLFGSSDPKVARKLKGKDIAGQWLALQYGWLPLISDVYSLVTEQHKREQRPWVFKTRQSQKRSRRYTQFGLQPGRSTGSVETEATASFMVRASPSRVFSTPAALGVTNPLVPLWEVVPWSFVVDWFIPVGNYLEQLTADHGWIFHDGCWTSHIRVETRISDGVSNSVTGPYMFQRTGQSIAGRGKVVSMERKMLNAFPTPSLPRFKNPLSMAHLWNSLALLTQIVSRK